MPPKRGNAGKGPSKGRGHLKKPPEPVEHEHTPVRSTTSEGLAQPVPPTITTNAGSNPAVNAANMCSMVPSNMGTRREQVTPIGQMNSGSRDTPEVYGSSARGSFRSGPEIITFHQRTGQLATRNDQAGDNIDNVNDGMSKITESTDNINEWIEDYAARPTSEQIGDMLSEYIRGPFFDKCKFLTSSMIEKWDSNENAVCNRILRDMFVKKSRWEAFWGLWAVKVNHLLNSRRNDVGNQLKIEFMSKYNCYIR
jgi:hypothetical protein